MPAHADSIGTIAPCRSHGASIAMASLTHERLRRAERLDGDLEQRA